MSTHSTPCPICESSTHYSFSSRDLMFNLYKRYDYYTCSVCDSVFQNPMPTNKQINSFYPANYSVFDEKSQNRTISPLKQALLWRCHNYSHLDPSPIFKLLSYITTPFYTLNRPAYIENGVLLDVGCGNGRYLSTMRSLGWSVQGVEVSEIGFNVCQTAGLNVHHGDLASATFPDNSFDVITVRHVIEHIRDVHALTDELSRILKPKGKLIIETPNSDALGREYLGTNWYANEVPRHLILFSKENLVHLMSSHALRLTTYWYETSPKIILNSIDYVQKNKGTRSKKVKWKRLLARIYVLFARLTHRGDIIHAIFVK